MKKDTPDSPPPDEASDSTPPTTSNTPSPSTEENESPSSGKGTGPTNGEVCQNCGASLYGEYCHSCGQRHLAQLQVRTLMRTFADALLNVAHLGDGLWETLREGARNPGRLARRYVDGERQRFVNPISYILIAITLLFVVYVILQEKMVHAMTEMYRVQLPAMGVDPNEAFASDGMYRKTLGLTSLRDMAEWALAIIKQSQTYVTVLFCLVAAALLRTVTSGYTYAELVVFKLYASGQAVLYHMLVLPIFLLTSMTYWLALGPVLVLGMLSLSGSSFFDRSLVGVILSPLSYIGAYVVIFSSLFLTSFLIGFLSALLGG